MLSVKDLHVNYGAINAVQGVSFDVNPGEVMALLGPNGAGKTSTLRAITALERFSGTITYEGHDVAKLGTEGCARLGLIHVPEGRHVFPTLSVHENLQIGTTAARGRPGYSFDDVYDLFPALMPLRDRLGWALSGGEQQMVAIGRALVAAPRMLLLDEPSLGLAPIVVKAVFSALGAIRSRTPILVVEQNTIQALKLCDRAAALSQGKVVMSGTAAEMNDRQALLDSYLGTGEVAKH